MQIKYATQCSLPKIAGPFCPPLSITSNIQTFAALLLELGDLAFFKHQPLRPRAFNPYSPRQKSQTRTSLGLPFTQGVTRPQTNTNSMPLSVSRRYQHQYFFFGFDRTGDHTRVWLYRSDSCNTPRISGDYRDSISGVQPHGMVFTLNRTSLRRKAATVTSHVHTRRRV